ncbi:MAG: MYXO-CTERM sorting domain-containing protein, partial [Kofleriaceae bacterium]|nr:MYXO-CTERM sorting domain-containing protein [Kofleriaceae bacterium]
MRLVLLTLAAALAMNGERPAFAFQIETPVTSNCHETITRDGARAAGFPMLGSAPAPTEDQARAMRDLTFSLPERDVWTMALLFGVRSNDLRDNQPIDIARLVHIHNDPDDQPAHCMRKSEHDGPTGDAQAIAACRRFVLGELETAGLYADTLDLTTTEQVPVYLAFRGRIDLALPRFAYHLGRALHAIEDGYMHAFRNPDTDAIRHVANWIDSTKPPIYDVVVDGYHHVGPLDDCRRDDPRGRDRMARATTAVTRLLVAIRDPAPGRRARIDAALDVIFAQELGCTFENRYCDAQELDEETSSGCAATPGPGGLLVLVGVLALVVRRRRRAWPWSRVIALVAALVPSRGIAERRLHLDARVGASLDHAAQATVLGAGVDLDRFSLGLAAEWNPWFSLDTTRANLGVASAYATLARRWYDGSRFTLYSRAEVGASLMLFELVGVDRYSTGLYLGGSLLGVGVPLGTRPAGDIDPAHIAIAVPQR